MRTTKIIAVLFAATAALGAGACGGDDRQDADVREERPTGTSAGDVHEKDAENKAENADELAEDVEIVACESGDGVGVDATVEVTNSLDEPVEYIGTIDFLDSSGAVITDGVFNTGTLQPGEKSTEEVPGGVYEVVHGATCELVEVKIDEPV